MSIRITADTDTNGPVYHRWFPADAKGDAFGTINFGRTGHGNCLYFSDTASIDETIAALVALKQEMDPPASPLRSLGCGMVHPNTRDVCELHRDGFHVAPGENEGDLDIEWPVDTAAAPERETAASVTR